MTNKSASPFAPAVEAPPPSPHRGRGDFGARSTRLVRPKLVRALLLASLALVLPGLSVTACVNRGDRPAAPTAFPQPTPNQTRDAVIRGLITAVVPTITRTATPAPLPTRPPPTAPPTPTRAATPAAP